MPRTFPKLITPRTTVDASPALAAETVVCTLGGISTGGATDQVLLWGQVNITIGTTGTALRLRIRQTSVTGTVVGDTGAITGGIAAANVVSQDVMGNDTPGDVGSFVYVMTAQVTAATAGSTVSSVLLTGAIF